MSWFCGRTCLAVAHPEDVCQCFCLYCFWKLIYFVLFVILHAQLPIPFRIPLIITNYHLVLDRPKLYNSMQESNLILGIFNAFYYLGKPFCSHYIICVLYSIAKSQLLEILFTNLFNFPFLAIQRHFAKNSSSFHIHLFSQHWDTAF